MTTEAGRGTVTGGRGPHLPLSAPCVQDGHSGQAARPVPAAHRAEPAPAQRRRVPVAALRARPAPSSARPGPPPGPRPPCRPSALSPLRPGGPLPDRADPAVRCTSGRPAPETRPVPAAARSSARARSAWGRRRYGPECGGGAAGPGGAPYTGELPGAAPGTSRGRLEPPLLTL